MNATLEADNALEAHRWDHRLLLVFSPRADDLRVRTLNERLASHACELRDRELIVGHFPVFGDARLGDRALSPESAARIRKEFRVKFGDFAVILVGKDGLEKRRDTEVPELDTLFSLIDTMPMRRAEMRSRGAQCAG